MLSTAGRNTCVFVRNTHGEGEPDCCWGVRGEWFSWLIARYREVVVVWMGHLVCPAYAKAYGRGRSRVKLCVRTELQTWYQKKIGVTPNTTPLLAYCSIYCI